MISHRPCSSTAGRWPGLDLASYADVKANAAIIYGQLTSNPPGMPPPPFDPFPQTFIDAFNTWMTTGVSR
jgi:hypothetical protein